MLRIAAFGYLWWPWCESQRKHGLGQTDWGFKMHYTRTDETCRVLDRRDGLIRFSVDSVEPATDRLAERTAADVWSIRTGRQADALSVESQLLVAESGLGLSRLEEVHPLVSAVHCAFAEHRPLVLSPDIIWLTICQGFGHHVLNNPEALRPHIVDFEGKQGIRIESECWGSLEDWRKIVSDFGDRLELAVKHELADVMRCDFSTSTMDTRVASQIVLMHTMQRYFAYEVVCICGIPRVTLRGTVDDWREIQSRVRALAQYDLGWWTTPLSLIAQRFVETAEGRPMRRFWQSIYKPEEQYGDDVFHGWLGDLFPYLVGGVDRIPDKRNPNIGLSLQEREGIAPSSIPIGLCSVPVRIHGVIPDQDRELVAGFAGVMQHTDLDLEPVIGWGVFHPDAIVNMLQDIQQQPDRHSLADPYPYIEDFDLSGLGTELPKALRALYERWDGATFNVAMSTAWKLFSFAELFRAKEKDTDLTVTCFGRLNDGRYLAHLRTSGSSRSALAVVSPIEPFENTGATESEVNNPSTCVDIDHESVRIVSDNADAAIPRLITDTDGFWFDLPDVEQSHDSQD